MREMLTFLLLKNKSVTKMMKNAFYFSWKALFVLKIFNKKGKVNFKFHDVTDWLENNRNTDISRYFEKQRQSDNEIWSVNRM